MSRAAGGAIIGGLVGSLLGPVGTLAGAGIGGYLGSNPTVIHEGVRFPIIMRDRENQPEFHDLHMRQVNALQLRALWDFFGMFNVALDATDITLWRETGEYFYQLPDGTTHILDPVAIEAYIYEE